MPDVETRIPVATATRLNVANRLAEFARQLPGATAVACPRRWSPSYRSVQQGKSGAAYATTTFAELDADATRIAHGLAAWGVPPGTRLALLVRPGIEFVTLVFAPLRAGMVIILVDPGLGRRNLIRCLTEAEPEGFVAVSEVQVVRVLLRRKFPRAQWNVTVGRRWFWGGLTLDRLKTLGDQYASLPAPRSPLPATTADDPAAIIFTSGSTGPPKGVLYTHRMFDTQVTEIQSVYGIEPGGIDLACFPLFALFNSAMGVTTVLPDMDFSRPATADPTKLLAAAKDWQVTQAFASPAVWRVLSDHCAKTGQRIASLRQVFSCGAPMPADVLRVTLACVGKGAKMHTPYGATECLPVSTIEAAEVLGETAAKTNGGAGVCVGRKFDTIDWRVIRITDSLIKTICEAEELPAGEVGELIVRGPQVSPKYVTCIAANAPSKIAGEQSTEYQVLSTQPAGKFEIRGSTEFTAGNPKSETKPWHRTGDVGYFDEQSRFWYCGRKSDRLRYGNDVIFYPVQCEAIVNTCNRVKQSAIVYCGARPVLVVELYPDDPAANSEPPAQDLVRELKAIKEKHAILKDIDHLFVCAQLPVDVRHNAKIDRDALSKWTLKRFAERFGKY